MNIPTDSRYWNPTFLTHSALSNFVSFDNRGIPTYSVYNLINPTQPDSDAVKIGLIADKVITEWLILSEAYSVKMTKEEMLDKLSKFDTGLTMKNTLADIKALYTTHYGEQEEITQGMYDKISTIVERSYNFQYSKTESLQDFIAWCEKQTTLQDDKRKRKGKADFIHKGKKVIADLKCVWNLDRFLSEIAYMGRLNITHRYPRQLAYYNDLTDTKDYDGELMVIDHTGRHIVIHIPNEMLRYVQETYTEPAIVKLYTILEQDSYTVQFADPRELIDDSNLPILSATTSSDDYIF